MDYYEWIEEQRSKTPRITSWKTIPAEEVSDPDVSTHIGTIRRSWVGENLLLTSVVVRPNSVGKIHTHEAEQVSIIVRGSVRVTIDGDSFVAQAGSIVHIPARMPHIFEILDEETEILDVYAILTSAEELRKSYPT